MRFPVDVATMRAWPERWPLPMLALAVPASLAFEGFFVRRAVESGGAFVLAFLALFALLAAPLLAVELALGRRARAGGGASLARGLESSRPGAGGRWWGLLVIPIAVFGLGATLYGAGASLHYAFAGLTGGPPAIPPEAYWAEYAGAAQEGAFDGIGTSWIHWAAAWLVLAALLVWNEGVRWFARVVVPLALAVALTVVLRLAVIDGGSDRLAPLFEPQWGELRQFETWTGAAAAAVAAAGVGLGVAPALGARLDRSDDVAGRGFAIAGFALLSLLMLAVGSMLAVGGEGAGALAEDGSFLFVTMSRSWQAVPVAEAWGAAWYFAAAALFLAAAAALAQPLLAFLADREWDRKSRTVAVLAVAFVVGQFAVFRAASGFLGEDAVVTKRLLAVLVVGAELVYAAWLGGGRNLLEDLRVGAVTRVPFVAQPILAVAAPATVALALAAASGELAVHTFALGSTGAGRATLYVSRAAMVAVLVLSFLLVRRDARRAPG